MALRAVTTDVTVHVGLYYMYTSVLHGGTCLES